MDAFEEFAVDPTALQDASTWPTALPRYSLHSIQAQGTDLFAAFETASRHSSIVIDGEEVNGVNFMLAFHGVSGLEVNGFAISEGRAIRSYTVTPDVDGAFNARFAGGTTSIRFTFMTARVAHLRWYRHSFVE